MHNLVTLLGLAYRIGAVAAAGLDASRGRRNLEKRAPDELSPKPDPDELRAPQGCRPYSNANGGQSIRANFVVTKSNRRQTSTAIDRQTRFLKYNRNNQAILPNAATANYQTALSINSAWQDN